MNNDQRIGIEIVRNSLTAPIKQLISNAGIDSSKKIKKKIGKILEENNPSFGYDIQNMQYADMLSIGIIEPVKVVRAGLIITTDVIIVESKIV